MLRLIMRGMVLLVLALLLVPAGFSKSPAKSKTKKALKETDDTTATTPSDSDTKADETTSPETSSESAPALPAQGAAGVAKSSNNDYKAAPDFTPMLATTGTIGLFTVE